jgi:hypothetical protein
MAPIPVVCGSCGNFFFAENLIGGSGTVTFSNVGYGPCPVCGGMGSVLDGTYEFVGDTVRLLAGPEWSSQRLMRVAALLHDLAHRPVQDLKPENLLVALAKEEPKLAAHLKPKSSTELVAWLTLLLMIVQVLLGLGSQRSITENDVEKIVQTVLEQTERQSQSALVSSTKKAPPPPPRKRRKVARKTRRR